MHRRLPSRLSPEPFRATVPPMATSPPPALTCPDHPEAPAAWRCLSCERLHCEECVKRLETRQSALEVCRACGGVVSRVQVARPEAEVEVRTSLRMLATPEAAVTAAALAVPAWLAHLPVPVLNLGFGAIYFAAVSAYVLQIVDHIGRGQPHLPSPGELGTSLLGAVGRGFVVAFVVLAPVLVWGATVGMETVPAALGGFLMALLGLSWAPAALISVTLHGTALAAWWVPAWLEVVRANPREYARLTGAFTLAGAGWLLVSWALHWVLTHVQVFGSYLAAAASTLALFVLPVLVGVYLRRHADELGLVTGGLTAVVVPPKPPPALR